ncbi:dihydrofolate reductase family protein [Dactylosporangium sp. CS-047395]|uniref:dihydrofolate reductase family protein n=1 Tax=Dactylosporangium sp. CS-047395 TaxID=3239936 RepID=UPI003D8BDBF7
MRALTYYIGATIDGYIAGPGGETEFFPLEEDVLGHIAARYPETLPTHVRARFGIDAPNQRFDTVLMGRATYQPALDAGIAEPYAHLRQHIVSTTLPGAVRDPLPLVRELKAGDGLGIWLCGGARLAGTLLPEIDELVIKQYPIVAGAGIPLFTGAPFGPLPFALEDAETFKSGAVILHYSRRS